MSHDVRGPSAPRRKEPGSSHKKPDLLRADLKAYLDGELSRPRRWLMDWHLARCAECREEVAWLKRLGEDMKDLERAVPRPELRARILASLPETPPRPVAGENPRRAPRPALASGFAPFRSGLPRLAVGGALALLLVGGVFAMNRLATHNTHPTTPEVGPQTAVVLPSDRPSKNIGSSNDLTGKPSRVIADSKDASGNGSSPTTTDPEDDLNKKAEALYQQRLQELARQEQQQWEKMVASSPAHTRAALSAGVTPPRLTLALKEGDLTTGRERLQALTQRLGGRVLLVSAVDAPSEAPRSVAPSAPTGLPTPPVGKNDPQIPTSSQSRSVTLALKIPAARVADLVGGLNQLGRLNRLPVTAKSDLPRATSVKPLAGTNAEAPGKSDGVVTSKDRRTLPPERVIKDIPPQNSAGQRDFGVPREAAGAAEGRQITILVRLQVEERTQP